MAVWQPLPGVVRHGFTHFRLELEVWAATARATGAAAAVGRWTRPGDLDAMALPTLFRKVVRLAQNGGSPRKNLD